MGNRLQNLNQCLGPAVLCKRHHCLFLTRSLALRAVCAHVFVYVWVGGLAPVPVCYTRTEGLPSGGAAFAPDGLGCSTPYHPKGRGVPLRISAGRVWQRDQAGGESGPADAALQAPLGVAGRAPASIAAQV